jgi:hypothetical protein
MSSQRQLLMTIGMYAGDSNGIPPIHLVSNRRWDLTEYLRSECMDNLQGVQQGYVNDYSGLGLLWRWGYLGSNKPTPDGQVNTADNSDILLFGCPSMNKEWTPRMPGYMDPDWPWGNNYRGHYAYLPVSHKLEYMDNAPGWPGRWLIWPTPDYRPTQNVPLAAFPNRIILSDIWHDGWDVYASPPYQKYQPAHGLYYFNQGYADGHCKAYSGNTVANYYVVVSNHLFFTGWGQAWLESVGQ